MNLIHFVSHVTSLPDVGKKKISPILLTLIQVNIYIYIYMWVPIFIQRMQTANAEELTNMVHRFACIRLSKTFTCTLDWNTNAAGGQHNKGPSKKELLHLCPDVNRGTDAPWPPVPQHSPGSEAKDAQTCCFPSPSLSSELKHYSMEAKSALNITTVWVIFITRNWCVTLQLPWNSKAQIPSSPYVPLSLPCSSYLILCN